MKTRFLLTALASASALSLGLGAPATAQSGDNFLGDIVMTGYTFCPRTMADANGQLLPISQYDALFSLLGTTYGGDGRTTFALPDMRGRAPVHTGQGPGLPMARLGQRYGSETNTMSLSNLPTHNHAVGASTSAPNQTSPGGHSIGSFTAGPNRYAAGTPDTAMESSPTSTVTSAGGSQAFTNIMPFQTIRYCVVLQGIYPSRS
jgi:microcystin-dependent protein